MRDVGIPAGIEGVTATWLQQAMHGAVGDARIEGVEVERIGEGIGLSSALYRVVPTYDRASGGPESLVVKLPALDEAAHFTCTAIRMYHREVSFLREVATTCPFGTPQVFFAASEADTGANVIVMEDLGGLRSVDQLEGIGEEDVRTAVQAIARLHAQWWGRDDEIAGLEAMLPLDDPIYPMVLPDLYADGWAKAREGLAIPESIGGVGPSLGHHIEMLLQRLAASPVTFCHGDWRADNLLFADDGALTAVDFQLGARGVAAYDVAYLTSQSLTVDDRRRLEGELIELYRETAASDGVAAGDLERVEDDYDHAALFCLVYPIIALRNVELDDTRGVQLMQVMLDRVAATIGDRDLGRLLP